MRHREAQRHLADLLAGELGGDQRAAVERHLAGCEACSGWSETYGFLADALPADPAIEHATSEQLAHLAVDAELLTAVERERLATHLEDCADCRHELEITRAALADARRPASVVRFPLPAPSAATARRLALAASLILAAAVTFVALRQGGDETGRPATAVAAEVVPTEIFRAAAVWPEPLRLDGVGPGVLQAAAVRRPAARRSSAPAAVPADRRLSGDVLLGNQLIEAPRLIAAGAVSIGAGSAITFRAGEMVVLEDGFSIGSTATLGVEIMPATGAAESSKSRS